MINSIRTTTRLNKKLQFDVFSELLEKSGYDLDEWAKTVDLVLLVPIDESFNKMNSVQFDKLMDPERKHQLRTFIRMFVCTRRSVDDEELILVNQNGNKFTIEDGKLTHLLINIVGPPIAVNDHISIMAIDGYFEYKLSDIITKEDEKLWTWGNKTNPMIHSHFKDMIVTKVSHGDGFSAAITSDGKLWTWGPSYANRLGRHTSGNKNHPPGIVTLFKNISKQQEEDEEQIMESREHNLVRFVDVGCGHNHVLALDDDGNIWSWGSNFKGQLGRETENQTDGTPSVIDGFKDRIVIQISCGKYHSAVLTNDGQIWTCGGNKNGQLGRDTETEENCNMAIVDICKYKCKRKYNSISCGGNHTGAITDDGKVHLWGDNNRGQLGKETLNIDKTIRPVSPSGILSEAAEIACGEDFTMVRLKNRNLYNFGCNRYGQLGRVPDGGNTFGRNHSSYSDTNPVRVLGNVVQIAAGNTHAMALVSGGIVYTTGNNDKNQLGRRSIASDKFDVNWVAIPTDGLKIREITAGGDTSAAMIQE